MPKIIGVKFKKSPKIYYFEAGENKYKENCSRLVIYFTADNRIDFRDLVKDLASTFHTRIELRQIGSRDE